MPDLSLFKPLCEILGITINDLISVEKLNKDNYINLLFGGDRKLIQYEFEFFD